MKNRLGIACALLGLSGSFICSWGTERVEKLIDTGWNFTYHGDSAAGVKGYSKVVDLPHDWSIDSHFVRNAPMGNDGGYLPGGKGSYLKKLNLTSSDINGKKNYLLFEGVYERWHLIVNGDTVGFKPYGYSSVVYDVSPYLREGENTIQVEVDNSHQKNCRWYSGSGIYRHVKMLTSNDTHIKPWSVFITTPGSERANVEFEVEGISPNTPLAATVNIKDKNGRTVASRQVSLKNAKDSVSLPVTSPMLWSVESPELYTAEIELKDSKGNVLDNVTESFGFREIAYSATDGFLLNGKPMTLNGACVHHDNGMLGAASYDAAEARKVRLLKDAGFNAVRTSHNPASPAFLDECDRQGLLVIDEAFDGWREKKTENDYSLWIDEWGVTDMGDLVKRDRNHPSVMAWSIGNEVIERKKIEVVSTARKLAKACRELDPTRPVTEALCAWDPEWEIFDPHAEALDIVGYNYMIHKSESDHERCPERVMWQTESYPRDAAQNWKKVRDYPYIIGDFVWTGIDYLGESGIGRYFYEGQTEGEHYQRDQWPWHGAYCGDIDITGWRKPISHYRDMLHNGDRDIYMAVCEPSGYYGNIKETTWSVWPTWESWNWPGYEGKPIEVAVVSRFPNVRLYHNGDLVGEEPAGFDSDYMAIFRLPYQPGILKAVSVDRDGKECESTVLQTSGAPFALRITPDKKLLQADGQDLAYLVVEAVDSKGKLVPNAEVDLTFDVKGEAELKACGSADLTATDTYADNRTKTWKGRALGIVKSGAKAGKATVKVSAPGLKGTSLTINIK